MKEAFYIKNSIGASVSECIKKIVSEKLGVSSSDIIFTRDLNDRLSIVCFDTTQMNITDSNSLFEIEFSDLPIIIKMKSSS